MAAAAEHVAMSPGLALDLLAIAPAALGGIVLRGLPGPGRDAVLERLDGMLGPSVRVPANVSEDRLTGGLDITATLRAQRPVYESGLLQLAHRKLLVLSMAERLQGQFVALVCQAIDQQQVHVERDGHSEVTQSVFCVAALDESLDDDEPLAAPLADRLAFQLDTSYLYSQHLDDAYSPSHLTALRNKFGHVAICDEALTRIARTALGFGILSLRASLHAATAARALAAQRGADTVNEHDVERACQLVFAHRVRQLPPPPDPPSEQPDDNATRNESDDERDAPPDTGSSELMDSVVEAVTAVLPEQLLKSLAEGGLANAARSGRGATGATNSERRGRPVGVRPVNELGNRKLNVLATVKAAAPWQKLRGASRERLRVLPEDFRVTRYKPRSRTTTVFVVDASGSSAARRLAEVKGAVEMLLAECYVTRARVAVIAFRREAAELLLAPTRSLTRARRQLADLPGGGATPLASAIDVTRELCMQLKRQAEKAQVIFLTDGHGNVSRDGEKGHPDATEHALTAAKEFQALGTPCLVIDTSRRPRDRARRVADALGARYLPLPYADAGALAGAVASTSGSG